MCYLGGREVLFKTEEGKPACALRTNRVWNASPLHAALRPARPQRLSLKPRPYSWRLLTPPHHWTLWRVSDVDWLE